MGKTKNPNFRLGQHFNEKACAWTTKYPPIEIVEIIEGDPFDEDKYTKIYMAKYGTLNVRGGSYCQLELTNEIIHAIHREIDGATDKCFNCGGSGHFVTNCPLNNKLDINDDFITII